MVRIEIIKSKRHSDSFDYRIGGFKEGEINVYNAPQCDVIADVKEELRKLNSSNNSKE